MGLPLGPVAINTLWGWGLIPNSWNRSPEDLAWASSVPLTVFFPFFPPWEPYLGVGNYWSQLGPWGPLACVDYRQRLKLSLMCCLYAIPHLFPLLCSDSATGPSPLCPSQLITALCPSSPSLFGNHIIVLLLMLNQCVSGGELCLSATIRDLGCLWCSAWVSINNDRPPPPPDSTKRPGCFCIPRSTFLPGHDHPAKLNRFNTLLRCGVNSHGALAQLRLSHALRWLWETWQPLEHTSFHPVLGYECAPHERAADFSLPSQ